MTEEISPDHAARRIICASMAYYSLDEALLSDGEFDRLDAFDNHELAPIRDALYSILEEGQNQAA